MPLGEGGLALKPTTYAWGPPPSLLEPLPKVGWGKGLSKPFP